MNKWERAWKEAMSELGEVGFYLQRWWNTMETGEQLFTLGVVSAACLLLGLRGPSRPRKMKRYSDGNPMSVVQQFMFGAVVLIIFTFGIDIALKSAV